jgi:hypothetical protein
MNKTNCLLKTAELLAKLAVSNNQKNIQYMKMSEWHYLFTVLAKLAVSNNQKNIQCMKMSEGIIFLL